MPNSGWLTLTGEGGADLNAGTPVHVIVVQTHISSVTNPKVRVMGSTWPRRVLYAGSFGFAHKDANPSSAIELAVSWSHSIGFEAEDLALQEEIYTRSGALDTLIYKLRAGVTLQVKVFW